MALHLWYQDLEEESSSADSSGNPTFVEMDLEANGFSMVKHQVSYSHPSMLAFRLHMPQHTRPIPMRALVVFYDDASYSYASPNFEGHVWEIKPVESNVIEYVCYDQTMKARHEITIMSGPHGNSTVIPRLVYNAKIDNDDDYAFEVAHNAEIGEMIDDILTNAYNELYTNCFAAPAPGGDAFVSADLTALDFIPQEKMVFESENLGSGLDRLLNQYPGRRMIFIPGSGSSERKWRFVDIKSASQVTLTLNDFSTKKVLSMSLANSIDGRFTAVKIFGPETTTVDTVYVGSGGLTEEWTTQEGLNFENGGPGSGGIGDAGKKWSIADSSRQRMSRLLPEDTTIESWEFSVNGNAFMYRVVREPVLQVSFDSGTTWELVPGIQLDRQNGIITTPTPIYREDASASGGYVLPDDARLTYAYYDDPLNVRYPDSGYEGTAYSVDNIDAEYKFYDEMLAVGYELNGTPVTTSARQSAYLKLAEQWLESRKDTIWTGGCVLAGIDYDFLRLQKRINFAAVDGDGGALTTGWEAINAILTDVEYDFEEDTTTLTFSSDKMDFTLTNIDQLKSMLKIRAQNIFYQYQQIFRREGNVLNIYDTYTPYVVEEGEFGPQIIGGL